MKKLATVITISFCCFILLSSCEKNKNTQTPFPPAVEESEESTDVDLPPVVMVDGRLYMDMGYVNSSVTCGTADGEITSSVDSSKIPEKDNESNFGTGYEYQLWDTAHINVKINDKWIIFQDIAISSWTIPDCVAHFTAEVTKIQGDSLLVTVTENPDKIDWLLGELIKPVRLPIDNLDYSKDGKTVTAEGLKGCKVEVWFDGTLENGDPETSYPAEPGQIYKIRVIED
ncbi:MAG: hypothetical protein GX222_00045 [Ruminococcaceae bacterium]|nr:hypothetical protein [Oscillospiraceae bacterium]